MYNNFDLIHSKKRSIPLISIHILTLKSNNSNIILIGFGIEYTFYIENASVFLKILV